MIRRPRCYEVAMATDPPISVAPEVEAALSRLGLIGAGDDVRFTPLTGGVSSDIWRVDRPGQPPICVKQAASQLRVEADWRVPVERNAFEAAWLRRAGDLVPGMAPRLLGEDRATGLLAMEYLPPGDYPVWKQQLLDGQADPGVATAVADRLGRLHAATAHDNAVANAFQTDEIFWGIRLDPYLIATATAHPDLHTELERLAKSTAATRLALVHGDVSPKNILIGPDGPVLLDAECAWYGDPAFDLAFCLNHLLLKCLAAPQAMADFLSCFNSMVSAYLPRVDWEPPADLERRAAALLPALTLARVDGKSPVEYIVADAQKALVRRAAIPQIKTPRDQLSDIAETWRRALTDAQH